MDKHLKLFLHVAFWAFMFLSPLSFMRGQGVSFMGYLMSSMTPLLLMIIFYANYLWLTPRFFASGKHRYFLLINLVLIVCLGAGLHYWNLNFHQLFDSTQPHQPYTPKPVGEVFFILRDIITMGIFAAVGTAIVLAQRWENNVRARREAEAARTEAELKTLRSQINPHFLLNTLNNIYALTAFDPPKAQDAIQELSKMLRYLLYDCEQSTVPLIKDIEFIQNYISLMRIRLPESVDIKSEFSISNQQQQIAPMIFIWLIENAFKHGVSPTDPSFIHISIEATEHEVVCDISNSNHPKSANDHSGHGIGLNQVQRRLDLSYPDKYQWTRGCSENNEIYNSKIVLKL